jgi:tripartite-type tricarboxylate transporter receptor subunit TctC
MTNPPFDPVADFAPICEIYNSRSALYVPASSPAKSVQDVVEMARKKPGTITYGSQGNGSIGHILGTKFQQVTGVKLIHVPYRGSAPALADLLTGRIDMMLNNYGSFAGAYNTGKIRALGVISPVRMSVFPNVPTMSEAGYPKMEFQSWFGLVAPKGTPQAMVQKLNEIFVKAASDPEIDKWLNEQGLTLSTSSSGDFANLIKEESARMKEFVISNNMR